jgi:hypothetical protein
LFVLVGICVFCASTALAQSSSAPKPAELERAVRDALTKAQSIKGSPDSAAVQRMVDFHRSVASDTQLPLARREALRRALAVRLNQWHTILAQQFPPGGLAQPQANQPPDTLGPDLVKLIEETLHPTSWDNVGGVGVIRFWGPANVLVVRQTTEAHEDLQKLIDDLR